MELVRGSRVKKQNKIKHLPSGRIGLNSDTQLVIKLPDSRVLRVISRSVFLALIIFSLPCIRSIFKGHSGSYINAFEYSSDSDLINFELLLQDLGNEGLIKKGDKALIVSSVNQGLIDSSRFLNDKEIDFVMESDFLLEQQSSFADEAFDFVFSFGYVDRDFVDRIVKIGGIVAVQLSSELSNAFQKLSNYRIVFLRRYNGTIVALRKIGAMNKLVDSSTKRRLCQSELDAKKAALEGLEDVFLEPPRRALGRSDKYLRRFKFLPDLLGDSLESYPRRIFIDVDCPNESSNAMNWFHENYPTRNQEFEILNIEMVPEVQSRKLTPLVDVSNWLMKNVKEEEYVVVKAEAEVVEEMIKRRTICLVDELFLECKNQWQDGGRKKSKRAYWECLALYGRLKDEGVAVHQWWN